MLYNSVNSGKLQNQLLRQYDFDYALYMFENFAESDSMLCALKNQIKRGDCGFTTRESTPEWKALRGVPKEKLCLMFLSRLTELKPNWWITNDRLLDNNVLPIQQDHTQVCQKIDELADAIKLLVGNCGSSVHQQQQYPLVQQAQFLPPSSVYSPSKVSNVIQQYKQADILLGGHYSEKHQQQHTQSYFPTQLPKSCVINLPSTEVFSDEKVNINLNISNYKVEMLEVKMRNQNGGDERTAILTSYNNGQNVSYTVNGELTEGKYIIEVRLVNYKNVLATADLTIKKRRMSMVNSTINTIGSNLKVNRECTFLFCPKDERGNMFKVDQSSLSAIVNHSNYSIPCIVTMDNGGNYKISFIPKIVGPTMLTIDYEGQKKSENFIVEEGEIDLNNCIVSGLDNLTEGDTAHLSIAFKDSMNNSLQNVNTQQLKVRVKQNGTFWECINISQSVGNEEFARGSFTPQKAGESEIELTYQSQRTVFPIMVNQKKTLIVKIVDPGETSGISGEIQKILKGLSQTFNLTLEFFTCRNVNERENTIFDVAIHIVYHNGPPNFFNYSKTLEVDKNRSMSGSVLLIIARSVVECNNSYVMPECCPSGVNLKTETPLKKEFYCKYEKNKSISSDENILATQILQLLDLVRK